MSVFSRLFPLFQPVVPVAEATNEEPVMEATVLDELIPGPIPEATVLDDEPVEPEPVLADEQPVEATPEPVLADQEPDEATPKPVAETEPQEPVQTSLEEKQALLSHMVRMVARKVSHGLFVSGSGGMGKSRVISQTLAAEGVVPVLINSHITPLSLYATMYQHRQDQVLWLDDTDVYGNLRILGLLRSALWGQGERIVTYSSTQLQDVPSSFVFDSRIIFCANNIPSAKNEAFKAVLSRIDVFELAVTNEEIVEQMQVLAAKGFESLSPASCREVVQFIERSGGTRQLSMRLYEPSLKKVEYALANNIDWHDLVACQLDQLGEKHNGVENSKAFLVSCLEQAVVAFPESVRAQEDYFCQATGKSRATFFRLKRNHEANKGADHVLQH